MRRSHRVIVEVTFAKNVTAKHAVSVVREALARGEIEELGTCSPRVKEAERVLQAEIRQRQRVASQMQASD